MNYLYHPDLLKKNNKKYHISYKSWVNWCIKNRFPKTIENSYIVKTKFLSKKIQLTMTLKYVNISAK